MNKFWIICKREYLQIVKKKSFVIGILLTPALMAAIMVVPAWMASKQSSSTDSMTIVDQSGLGLGQRFADEISGFTLPDSEEPAYLIRPLIEIDPLDIDGIDKYQDSLTTLITDEIDRYVLVISPDPLVSDDNLYLITNADNMRAIRQFERTLTKVISVLRVEQAELGVSVDSILTLTRDLDLKLRDTQGEAIPFIAKFLTAIIFVMMIYMLIVMHGATLMRSVIEEKNSRIMEVLLSSVSPFQLMLGKVIGFGAAAFTQVGAWVLMGALMMLASGSMAFEIDFNISRIVFNPVIVVSFVMLFISGYVLYSTLFALIGSIVNSDKEAQSFIFPITMALIIPIMVGSSIAQDPNVGWATIMSFIPFFAPTMMMMRVMFIAPTMTEISFTSGIIPEAIISFLLVCLTTVVVVWITGKIFRVGILMYGKRPTLPEIIKWIKY